MKITDFSGLEDESRARNGNPKMPDAFLLNEIYKNAGDNISQRKSLQWNITNYTVALYAAVVAAFRGLDGGFLYEKITAISAVYLIFLFSLYLIINSQNNIEKFRRRISIIYKNSVDKTWVNMLDLPAHAEAKILNHDKAVVIIMMMIVFVGFLSSLYIISIK